MQSKFYTYNKISSLHLPFDKIGWKKLLNKPKLWAMKMMAFLFLTLFFIQVKASSYASEATIHTKDMFFIQVFEHTYDQANDHFSAAKFMTRAANGINLKVKDVGLQQVLEAGFKNRLLTYTDGNKVIIAKRKQVQTTDKKWSKSQNQAIPPIEVTGQVTDSLGNPLIGVTIAVQGGNAGATTDVDGNYSITVPEEAVLIVSYVGFQTKKVLVNGRESIDIVLTGSVSKLDQLVVVGYGTQKKENLTGSIATISSEELENRPVTNVSSALAGTATGLSVIQGSGDPRSDGASINIRGIGTLNNSSPLVIIDGIKGSIDDISPNDIESISVLKDAASASIYGAEAANGVILIKTKEGSKGTPTVTYSGLFSFVQPINKPDLITSQARTMSLVNEGANNLNQSNIFAQSTIDEWKEASKNPNGENDLGVPNWLAYPNTVWNDAIFQHNLLQKHDLGVSGGGEHVLYRLSAEYLKNPGTMPNTGSEQYRIRANVETEVGKRITLGTRTYASKAQFDLGDDATAFNFLRATTPGIVPRHNGKYGYPQAKGANAQTNNILAILNRAQGNDRISRFNTTLYGTIKILDGLTLNSKVNYNTWLEEKDSHTNVDATSRYNFATQTMITQPTTPDQLTVNYSTNKYYNVTLNHILRYNTTIGINHSISAMAGYEEFYHNTYNYSASKKGLIDPTITTLGSANEMQSIGGSESDYSMRSWFGRVNYGYKGKYLLEGNIRYDGSSRFSSDSRWGTFPSFSAGWRISEEPFWNELNWDVQDLKVRISWGELGNSKIGNYDYQANYSSVNYSFDGRPTTGLRQSKLGNNALEWESTTVTDIGIDATLLKGRMNLTLDFYHKQTDGILTSPPIHLTMGTVDAPTRNTAGVLNKGVEVSIGWQQDVGEFHYSVAGNFSYNLNEVSEYKGKLKRGFEKNEQGDQNYVSNLGDVSSGGSTRILEGHTINEYFMQTLYHGDGSYYKSDGSVNPDGGPNDGMIRTSEDLQWLEDMMDEGYHFLPVDDIGKTHIYYGDFIYADNNRDGIYGNTYDRMFTGFSTMPKYTYGLRASVSWKGFDFFMLWSGNAGMKRYFNSGQAYHSNVVRNGYSYAKEIANNHYFFDEDNPNDVATNLNGKYPRLKYVSDPQNGTTSSFWLYDASYIKLRNIQFGYTFPEAWVKHVWMNKARIYISAENILMITDFPGVDPEVGSGLSYPTMKQFALGLNVTF